MKKKLNEMKKNALLGMGLLFVGCFALQLVSIAQDGSLDYTFGTDGIVLTDIENNASGANSVAIQSDGKIVAAGFSSDGLINHFAVMRYNTDRSLDNTFDSDGGVTTIIGSYGSFAQSVAVQSDGKIVAAGYSSGIGAQTDMALVRYNSNGSLDDTFDSDGIVVTPIGNSGDLAYEVVIQSDGKIVVAGSTILVNTSTPAFAVVRYDTNGIPDGTFGTNGIVITTIGTIDDRANSLAIQNDGKIVVAGFSKSGNNNDIALVRYNADGSLDDTFDTDGKVVTSLGENNDGANSIAIQEDGKIIIAGNGIVNDINDDFVLVRYNTNGSLDVSLDTDGIVTTEIGASTDIANSLVVQNDGKIVLAGSSNNGSNDDFAVVRFNANGSLDNTFDTDGIVTTTVMPGAADFASSMVLQSDGKIVLAGIAYGITDFALVRYNGTSADVINSTATPATEINIFPNPFSSTTTIQTDSALKNGSLTVYNSIGQPVHQINNVNGKMATLSRNNLPSGIYYIRLVEDFDITKVVCIID